MGFTFDPGPVKGETGIEGVYLDFNYGVRIVVPEGDYRVRFYDMDTGNGVYDAAISNMMATSTKKYYVRFRVELWKGDERILNHEMDLKGQNVHFKYPIGTLGDMIAWFPYADEFRQKHGCNLYCTMHENMAEIFAPSYPDIHFLKPDDERPDFYATYYMGLFANEENACYQPIDHRLTGLQKCIPIMLGLEDVEVRPRLKLPSERIIKEPYVCIAVQTTSYAKYWNNPTGWDETVDYLKKKGYRVLCIDKYRSLTCSDIVKNMPEGAEDFTGDKPLQERIDLLAHADFFIGLSSGLSWLAWAVGIPVVMIAGFTYPYEEFHTPYRVINYHVCTGCWNDVNLKYDLDDFFTCPRFKDTPRRYECSRFITSDHVCRTIDRLMEDNFLTGGTEGREV